MPAALLRALDSQQQRPNEQNPLVRRSDEQPKEVQIDLDKAIALACPAKIPALKPQPIRTGPTLKGWVVEISGNRPIATPAYWEDDGEHLLIAALKVVGFCDVSTAPPIGRSFPLPHESLTVQR